MGLFWNLSAKKCEVRGSISAFKQYILLFGDCPSNQLAVRYGSLKAFKIVERIGKGQFSDVHKVQCKEDGKYLALKCLKVHVLLDQKIINDCQKEIRLLEQLDHVNIIKYYTSFVEASQMYIVLELADAGDLNRLIRHYKNNRSLIPKDVIWKYFVQIMCGLEHKHSKRIMHRDIKPANVFITSEGIAKLGDLGLGCMFSQKTFAAHSLLGTPYYMSPERIQDKSYDFKSDMWSIGCILYEMAALQSLFSGDKKNLVSLFFKIENCIYPPIPSDVYKEQLRFVVRKCICADPRNRPDASEILTTAESMNAYYSDNAAVHAGNETNARFQRNNSPPLSFPAYSPDTNPIENLGDIFVRRDDAGNRQLKSLGAVKTAILAAWESIDTETLNSLVSSMLNR